ncbi:MAG: PAS domain S-box protein [Desulfobulbaceae bacterium]|nr:PAS domain S-box protein [Desulfobulbaceae bacterium]
MGTVQDITDRKPAGLELKNKTNFLDRLIENSALSTWISDEEGTAIRANPAFFEFFGATREEVIGKYNLFKDAVLEKELSM